MGYKLSKFSLYVTLALLASVFSVLALCFIDLDSLFSFYFIGLACLFLFGFVVGSFMIAFCQLRPRILQDKNLTFEVKYLNLIAYFIFVYIFVFALFLNNDILIFVSAFLTFIYIFYFVIFFVLDLFKPSSFDFTRFCLFVSSVYLILGAGLGLACLFVIFGYASFKIDYILAYQLYFMCGFVFLTILGLCPILLPFDDGFKFHLSKTALSSYILAGLVLFADKKMATIFFAIGLLCYICELSYVLARMPKFQLKSQSIIICIICLIASGLFYNFAYYDRAIFLLIFGFVSLFVLDHVYPFLLSDFYAIKISDLRYFNYFSYFVVAIFVFSFLLCGFGCIKFASYMFLLATLLSGVKLILILKNLDTKRAV